VVGLEGRVMNTRQRLKNERLDALRARLKKPVMPHYARAVLVKGHRIIDTFPVERLSKGYTTTFSNGGFDSDRLEIRIETVK